MKLQTRAVAGLAGVAAAAALTVLAPGSAQAAPAPATLTPAAVVWCLYNTTFANVPARSAPSGTASIRYTVAAKGTHVTAQQASTNGFHFGSTANHPNAWFNGARLVGTGTCFE